MAVQAPAKSIEKRQALTISSDYILAMKLATASAIKLATSQKSALDNFSPFNEDRSFEKAGLKIEYKYTLAQSRITVEAPSKVEGKIVIIKNTQNEITAFNDTSVDHFGNSRILPLLVAQANGLPEVEATRLLRTNIKLLVREDQHV